jgi:hypothetical protein
MKVYEIAGIMVEINPLYDSFFKESLDAYQTISPKQSHHIISSYITSTIHKPEGKMIQNKNPFIIKSDTSTYVYIKNRSQHIKAMFKYNQDFHKSYIFLNNELLEDPAEIEYVFMSMIFMEIALRYHLMSLHATAIVYDDCAILISAPSQTGKSTFAKHWLSLFPSSIIINDDKPLIKIDQQNAYVYGTPFSGKNKLNINQKYPLKCIVFLRQGTSDTIHILSKDDALKEIIKNIYRPMIEETWDITLPIIEHLLTNYDFIGLSATNSPNAAQTLYNYLNRGK